MNIFAYPELKYNMLRYALSKGKLEAFRTIVSILSVEFTKIIERLISQQDDNRKSVLNDLLQYGNTDLIEFFFSLFPKSLDPKSCGFLFHSLGINSQIGLSDKYKLLKQIINSRPSHFNLSLIHI
eukprot:TRINITY_DN35989_c0_g1_i1.p1 TRINITY_DN35989_c0_g1~~TRINITY_DN35989_c0_g1_i1.p1  ORF type:complete len:125 (-),score=10.53 TRINITY_DN35989_c0_g1_i1:166-540(-)